VIRVHQQKRSLHITLVTRTNRGMVTPLPVHPFPHPSIPEAFLPDAVKSRLQKDSNLHYPQSVLDKQKALGSPQQC